MELPDGVVIRDGVFCCCGPLHGRFARCVGSESPLAEKFGFKQHKPSRSWGSQSIETSPADFNFFLIDDDVIAARGKRPFTQAEVDDCGDCGHIHQARRYCQRHRALATWNVLTAAKVNFTMTRIDLIMAERGIDLTV